jgi:hypothetical protein
MLNALYKHWIEITILDNDGCFTTIYPKLDRQEWLFLGQGIYLGGNDVQQPKAACGFSKVLNPIRMNQFWGKHKGAVVLRSATELA